MQKPQVPEPAADALQAFSVATLCDALPGIRLADMAIRPLFAGARICGPARTAAVAFGENAAIHRALHHARPGEVLVVSALNDTTHGYFGDLLATCCRERGVAGIVIDGSIRDATEIRAMRYPVFCLGACPIPAAKLDAGKIDVEVTCGRAAVRPGDIVIGDDDGIAVVRAEHVPALASRAAAVASNEQAIRERILTGETTCEILGLNLD